MNTVNTEAMQTWVAALENPANEGRQIRGEYCDGQGGVCAVGLAHEIFDVDDNHDLAEKLTNDAWGYAALHAQVDGVYAAVPDLNDEGMSFWDIAQALRATHLKETT